MAGSNETRGCKGIHRVERRLLSVDSSPKSLPEAIVTAADDNETPSPPDPIIASIERALTKYEKRKGKRQSGSAADVPGIQREVEWIGERLKLGQIPRAELALLKLVDRQGQRSRLEDIVKT